MREEIQKFHNIVLQTYSALMHETLLHQHNIISESSKSYTFQDKDGLELPNELRGFFAMKEVDGKNTKYFIEEDYFKELPLRINDTEEIFFKDSSRTKSIVLRPTDITPFRIKAENVWHDNKQFVDSIAPFNHSHPDQWTLNKMVALMGYVGKTFCGICSAPEFGKSSIYLILDALTKKCPVFQPRSVPGVLTQITGEGNMIFDDIHATSNEVKKIMEAFSFSVGSNDPVYINGAIKSKHTKSKYDVAQQSITYIYNIYSNYSNPEKQFWDFIWLNPDAIKSRFLCLKFDGKLTEEFDKNFDIPTVADENKMFYIKIAKHLLYLKQLKHKHKYQRRYSDKSHVNLKGRHKQIYEEIAWIIDLYAENQTEYCKFVRLLNKAIHDYRGMINFAPAGLRNNVEENSIVTEEGFEPNIAKEEWVDDGSDEHDPKIRVFEAIDNYSDGKIPVEQLLEDAKVSEEVIKSMLKKGDIFEVSSGKIAKL